MQANSFIQYLFNNVSLDHKRVLECVDSLCDGNTDEMMRIMAYLSGYSDIPEVPKTSEISNSTTLISYNFFRDKVRYKYLESHEFKVSKEQQDLDGQEYNDWFNIPSNVRNGSGDFKITVKYWTTDTCSLEKWLKK